MVLLLDEAASFRRDVGVVGVAGPDRLDYLNSLMSQHFLDARPGTVADFLYLDAKGNAQAAGRAVVRAEDVLLLTPAAVAASLTDALARFTFLLQATSDNLSDVWAVASLRGGGRLDILGAPPDAQRAVPRGEGMVVRDRSGGIDLVGPAQWVDQQVAAAGLPEATAQQWEAWRISAGEPAWGVEITPGRRPQELGLLPTHVHLRKGCYPGQESVAKIYNLGRPRRALAVLELAGRVSPGDPVDVGGKTGEITSAAPAGAAWVALGLVPVDADGSVVGGGEVVVGDVRGRVRKRVGEDLVIPGA